MEVYTGVRVINATLWALSHTQQDAVLEGTGEVVKVMYDEGTDMLPPSYDPGTDITLIRDVGGHVLSVDIILGRVMSVSWPSPEELEAGVKYWHIEVGGSPLVWGDF